MVRGTVFCVCALFFMETKICSKCKIEKGVSLFGKTRNYKKDKIIPKSRCKKCENDAMTIYVRSKIDYGKIELESMPQETWAVFPLNTKYAVSNLSRVKSLFNLGYKHRESLVKQQKTKKGYMSVMLGDKRYQVHRVVAITYIGNPKNYPQINHKDCDKTNNIIDNLEWCNNSINIKHAWDNGLIKRSRKNV